MNYYKVAASKKQKENGKCGPLKNFGVDKYGASYDMFSDMSFNNQGKNEPIKGKPILPILSFNNTTKKVDYLWTSALSSNIYLIISPKFLSFLKAYLKEKYYQCWMLEAYLYKDKDIINYHLFHLSFPVKNFVNYSKCLFYTYIRNGNLKDVVLKDETKAKNFEDKIIEDTITIKSYNEYLLLSNQYEKGYKQNVPLLGTKKIVFDTRNIKGDIFRVFEPIGLISGYYVSQRLKDEIEKQGLTGMQFTPLEEVDKRIEVLF